MEIRDTRYAKTTDDVYIAYQVTGEGPIDFVWQFDFFGNVDLRWEDPTNGPWLRALSSLGRLILHDRRGTGLSTRNVSLPNLETRVADLRTVLDEIGADRVVLVGFSEGGAPNALFAATDPDRIHSLVWLAPTARSSWSRDYPWGVGPDYYAKEELALKHWGTAEYGQAFSETEAIIGNVRKVGVPYVAVSSRHTVTPDMAADLSRIWWETDIRGVLPSIRSPVLLVTWDGREQDVAETEYIASLMPDARTVVFTGDLEIGDYPRYLDAIREFVGIEQAPTGLDTILSTVLFTDIVGSTEKQSAIGDHDWKELVQRHHSLVREALGRWRGVENDTAGDGFYATFDGPARAIRCAQEVAARVRDLGIQIRAGVHTGECELIDNKCGGITVSIGARVASKAGPSEVLISQTVKDLVAGSGLSFEDAGDHELKGVPDRWHLYRAIAPAP